MKRNSREIKAWMARYGVSVTTLARLAGIKRQKMSDTIWGRRNDLQALQRLMEAGCPVKWLALPETMKGKQAA